MMRKLLFLMIVVMIAEFANRNPTASVNWTKFMYLQIQPIGRIIATRFTAIL
ncbi:MAG: hypothetical protein R3C26_26585 [Calditrichia bacterium]